MPGGTVAGPRHTAKSYGPAPQPVSGLRAAGGCPEAGSGSASPLAFRGAVSSLLRSGKMSNIGCFGGGNRSYFAGFNSHYHAGGVIVSRSRSGIHEGRYGKINL